MGYHQPGKHSWKYEVSPRQDTGSLLLGPEGLGLAPIFPGRDRCFSRHVWAMKILRTNVL